MCNRENEDTAMSSSLHLPVMYSCFWQSENEDTVRQSDKFFENFSVFVYI